MAITPKIQCNGIKPSKSEVYTLAAELVESENIVSFGAAIIEAFMSYDYYDNNNNYYNNHYSNYCNNCYNNYHSDYYNNYHNDYYNNYYSNSKEEKVITLLFLAAIYDSQPQET